MYTTYEDIRVEAGFQNRFTRQAFLNTPDGSATTFYVNTDDVYKIVSEFGTGNTVVGVSDVKVYTGLSGIYGISRMNVTAIDQEQGAITLDTAPDTGTSVIVSYASSPISDEEIEDMRLRAESMLDQRLGLCYNLPLPKTASRVKRLATELASAYLLIRNYGIAAPDTARDGYAILERLMGNQEYYTSRSGGKIMNGEIGLICSAGDQLLADDKTIISRNDDDDITADKTYKSGGLVRGNLYDISEEEFRYKQPQIDRNAPNRGSGLPSDTLIPDEL